jgi:error-prone DNA polymerase
MVAAGFSGGEAEELRRAMGFKRSVERMDSIEKRLREGMRKNGILGKAQDQIIQTITSFALYGFPESHAASFALIAYASAYLKAHHPACFYASLLNAWPMGFYHPATIVQDAQRHGVEPRAIDVNLSGWRCAPEKDGARTGNLFDEDEEHHWSNPPPRRDRQIFRVGLKFVKGLKEATGKRIEAERRENGPYRNSADLAARCDLTADDLTRLAHAGALSGFGLTRRAALWQVAKVGRSEGPLFRGVPVENASPLPGMTAGEETAADYTTSDLTVGPHLLAHYREKLRAGKIFSSAELQKLPEGAYVRTAGAVIVRQHPATAKGFVFLTLEDETGMSQAIVNPDLFRHNRAMIVGSGVLVVEGNLQHGGGQVSVRADRFTRFEVPVKMRSHDFY